MFGDWQNCVERCSMTDNVVFERERSWAIEKGSVNMNSIVYSREGKRFRGRGIFFFFFGEGGLF